MNRSGVVAVALACLFLAAAAGPALAGAPTDHLKGAVDRVIKTLEDPALKSDGKATERRQAVRRVANDIFDFGEIARRSLARHWQPRTDKEREEFVGLFADLLERSYISKIELYGGEKIQYSSERADGEVATVGTKIITKNGTEVPVDYRMILRGEKWMVYDVSIEGVSLVSNYRTQFNKIIQTDGYPALLDKLKSKQGELASEDGAPKKKPAPPKK